MKNDNLLKCINDSFKELTGQDLPMPTEHTELLGWLDESAPYSLLAHNIDPDPSFIYANSKALNTFGYSQKEMLNLKSKFSASEIDREARSQLLKTVKEKGIATNYNGPRVNKDGSMFTIYNGMVWVVTDEHKNEIGQAALFWLDSAVPEWFNVNRP